MSLFQTAVQPEEGLPLILVGAGKTLQLRTVTVLGAASLPACLHLGAGVKLIRST
jgi:vacuolar protein sorting-associated protein 13A/C